MSNKEKIMSAASQILSQKGPAGLSVRAISKLAGLSTIGIYNHYDGKQGILDALCIEAFELVYQVTACEADTANPRTAMLNCARNYVVMARDHEAQYRLIFGEAAPGYEMGPSARQAAQRAFDSLVRQAARLLPADASLAQQQQAAIRFWALVHGYVSIQHHAAPGLFSFTNWERQVLEATAQFIDGYQTSAAQVHES